MKCCPWISLLTFLAAATSSSSPSSALDPDLVAAVAGDGLLGLDRVAVIVLDAALDDALVEDICSLSCLTFASVGTVEVASPEKYETNISSRLLPARTLLVPILSREDLDTLVIGRREAFQLNRHWLLPRSAVGEGVWSALRMDSRVLVLGGDGDDGDDRVDLMEAYSQPAGAGEEERHRAMSKIATWDSTEKALDVRETRPVDERRADLRGATLVNVFAECPPYAVYDDGAAGGVGGMLGDLLRMLGRSLNFTTSLSTPPEGPVFAGRRPDGSFGGVVGSLSRGEADLSSTCLSVTVRRAEHVGHTVIIHSDSNTATFAVADAGVRTNSATFLLVLTPGAWVVVLCGCAALAAASRLADRGAGRRRRMHMLASCADTVLHLLQRPPDPPDSAHGGDGCSVARRCLYMTSFFFCYVCFSLYSAMLTSNMIDLPRTPTILSVSDLEAAGYELVVVRDSAPHAFLQLLPRWRPETVDYLNKMESDPRRMPSTLEEARALFSADSGNLAYFGPSASLSDLSGGRLTSPPDFEQSYSDPWAFGLRRDSELRGVIDLKLTTLEQSGVKDRLLKAWGLREEGVVGGGSGAGDGGGADAGGDEAVPLGFNNLALAVDMFLSGCGASVLVALGERLWEAWRRRTKRRSGWWWLAMCYQRFPKKRTQ